MLFETPCGNKWEMSVGPFYVIDFINFISIPGSRLSALGPRLKNRFSVEENIKSIPLLLPRPLLP